MGTEQRVFVLMPFRDEFDDVYLVIKDAVRLTEEKLGTKLSCVRADEISKPGRITEQIREEIENCDLIIVDLTGSNPNVMYELGYAHALHKNTVILNQDPHQSPFDVKDFRQILYDRNRLVKDCRPSLIAALSDCFGSVGQDEASIPVRTEGTGTFEEGDTAPHGPLRPSDGLVSQFQALHIKLRVANRNRDRKLALATAKEVRDLLAQITVVSGGDPDDTRNTAAVVGNCAVGMEQAQLLEEAEDVYRRAIGLFPDFAGLRIQYCDYLIDVHRIDEAERELDRAAELEPTDRRLARVGLKLAISRGDPRSDPTIEEQVRQTFESNPADSAAAAAYLIYLTRIGASPDLFEQTCLRWKASLSEADKYQADRALADYFAGTKDVALRARARSIYESLLLQSGHDKEFRAQVLHNSATLCDIAGDKDSARQYWSEAYELNPTDQVIRNSFSQRLERWGELDAALRVLAGLPMAEDSI